MVVDLARFPQWTGSIPFRVLRARSEADAARFAGRLTVLHFWGNLGGAGERFVECDSEDEAVAKLEGLHRLAKQNCPDVVITEEAGLTCFRDPASGGELRAELEPKSEYDASWQNNRDADAWLHPFGDDARALFWFVGDNVVHVGRSATEIVLLKHTAEIDTHEADQTAARAYVAAQRPGAPIAELTFTTSQAVVVWGPVAFEELEGFDPAAVSADDTAASTSLGTAFDRGVGAVVRVEPGRYAVSLGAVEPSESEGRHWYGQWCRLTRIDA
ncbi:hypothetical protein A7982_13172 [Minicystis rosea]|nr:hypothetical protein A7982_13172 [Minicystis rosea]